MRLEAIQLFKKQCVQPVPLALFVLRDLQLQLFALQGRSVLFQHLNALPVLKVIIVLRARQKSQCAQQDSMQLLAQALARHVNKDTTVVRVL